MTKLKKTNYDDSQVRNFVIKTFKERFNSNLISNSKQYKIDLLSLDDPHLGVEVENGKWKGDFWVTESYCKISNTGFPTLNIPLRKEKYWLDVNKRGKVNLSAEKNIFVRTNKDFTQFIIVRPETIRNSKKVYRTKFQPNNSNELEDWLSFKREDTETYNLIDDKFILDES